MLFAFTSNIVFLKRGATISKKVLLLFDRCLFWNSSNSLDYGSVSESSKGENAMIGFSATPQTENAPPNANSSTQKVTNSDLNMELCNGNHPLVLAKAVPTSTLQSSLAPQVVV